MTQKLNACVSMTAEAERCSGCGAQWCVCGLVVRRQHLCARRACEPRLCCTWIVAATWQCAEVLCSVLLLCQAACGPGCAAVRHDGASRVRLRADVRFRASVDVYVAGIATGGRWA